jgi:hypothetical protein
MVFPVRGSAVERTPEPARLAEFIGDSRSGVLNCLKDFGPSPSLAGLDGLDIMKHPDLRIDSVAFEIIHRKGSCVEDAILS